MPVAFVKEVPTDLFGRFGLLERFAVTINGAAGLTKFEWTGDAAPLTDTFERLWKEGLEKAKSADAHHGSILPSGRRVDPGMRVEVGLRRRSRSRTSADRDTR